jgi:hypothetical protein
MLQRPSIGGVNLCGTLCFGRFYIGFGSLVNVVMSGDSNGSVGREVHIPLVYINYLQRMTARQLTIGRRHRNKVLGGHAMLSYLPIR